MLRTYHVALFFIVMTLTLAEAGKRKPSSSGDSPSTSSGLSGTYELSGADNTISLHHPLRSGEDGVIMLDFNALSGPGSDAAQVDSLGHLRLIGKVAYGTIPPFKGCSVGDYNSCYSAWRSKFELLGYASFNVDLGTQTSHIKDGTRTFYYFGQYTGKVAGTISFDRDLQVEHLTYQQGIVVRREMISIYKDRPIDLKATGGMDSSLIQDGNVVRGIQVDLSPSLNGVFDDRVYFFIRQITSKVQ